MPRYFIQPFILLDSTKQKLIFIGICLVFSIFFLNVFVPFNINTWENDSGFQQFFRISSICVVGVLVLIFTQFVLRKLFKIESFKRIEFIAWVFLEIILITFVLSVFFNTYNQSFFKEFLGNLRYTLLLITILYFIALLTIYAFAFKQKNNTETLLVKTGLIGIPNAYGILKISIQLSDLLYIESADNYVSIYYLDEGKTKRTLIRNTLKNLETVFSNSTLKRCHRSYIVNMNNIKLIEKNSGKFQIHVKNCDYIIPISDNYADAFKKSIP